MRRVSIVGVFLLCFHHAALSVEGMWIPSLIQLFHSDMQTYGLKLSPEEVYATNRSSLKDAIVQFNGGCTAEIVSEKGLILTNHHCGLHAIQKHSSPENDYLKNGFWAASLSEELPCPWLRITLVKAITDVTEQVLKGVAADASESERKVRIRENSRKIEQQFSTNDHVRATVKPFNQGNAYFMLVTEDYHDIRLVGAPPSAIGKYGGDTDNWVWPRHTGDFSIFRIYANSENKPASHSVQNRPYLPKHVLPISLKPKKEGDFTMVYGFPGQTDQHYTARKLKFYVQKERPARIQMRQTSLDVIKPAMRRDDLTRIRYASKQARIANAWKKWIGQIKGLKELDAIEKKRAFEATYQERSQKKQEWKEKYGTVIAQLNQLQDTYSNCELARALFVEYFFIGPEFIRYVFQYCQFLSNYEKLQAEGKVSSKVTSLLNASESFFKGYNRAVDQQIFNALTPVYLSKVDAELLPSGMRDNWRKQGALLFERSVVMHPEKIKTLLTRFSKKSVKKLEKDPAVRYVSAIYATYSNKVKADYQVFKQKEQTLMRTYVAGIIEMFPEKKLWADANSTLRITYGKIDGSAPYDGMRYTHYTTIDGVLQKYDPNHPDFTLTDRFIALYNARDFGDYTQDGELWVCFTASNHTTGGNSGSPVIDADGNLIGINFDRSWESTMSDFVFDTSRCRNIAVDIRYVLWVIDKYGQAEHLVQEMQIVR